MKTTTEGIFVVRRTKALAFFAFGSKGDPFADQGSALRAAEAYKLNHRRSARCIIDLLAPTGQFLMNVVKADEAEPVKGDRDPATPREPRAPKSPKGGAHKMLRDELFALRDKIREASLSQVAMDATEAEHPIVRAENFREVRARISQKRQAKIISWRFSGKVIVLTRHIDDYR